jgi:hypothetical protein
MQDIILGRSTLERLRPRNSTSQSSCNRFIYVPYGHNTEQIAAGFDVYEFQLLKNERLYDLGWKRNIQQAWTRGLNEQPS